MSDVHIFGEEKQPLRPREATGEHDDEDTIPIVLCGGPYGETKETGKAVRVRKGTLVRRVEISSPESRLVWTRKGNIERWDFVPSSEPGVWRPKKGEKVPN